MTSISLYTPWKHLKSWGMEWVDPEYKYMIKVASKSTISLTQLIENSISQEHFICSKPTIEILEKGIKYDQS